MRRAGIFFLVVTVVAGLAAMGRAAATVWPPARFFVVTREENPTAEIESVAETLPLTVSAAPVPEKGPVIKDLREDAAFLALGPDERLEVLAGEVLRLIYEVDGQEPEQAQMLELISGYVTQPYFDYFIQAYSEGLMSCRRDFLEFQLDEIFDENVRDAWGDYRITRNVLAKIHIGHEGRLFWIVIKCVFRETGETYPLDQKMDQILYMAG
jgi:hypothetical protein